jgi:hypothetical protein
VRAEHGFRPRATRWATKRATAARQEWSALTTWLRKIHSVTSGEKMRSIHEAPTSVSVRATSSSERTSLKGNAPSWANWRRRNCTWDRHRAGFDGRIREASSR